LSCTFDGGVGTGYFPILYGGESSSVLFSHDANSTFDFPAPSLDPNTIRFLGGGLFLCFLGSALTPFFFCTSSCPWWSSVPHFHFLDAYFFRGFQSVLQTDRRHCLFDERHSTQVRFFRYSLPVVSLFSLTILSFLCAQVSLYCRQRDEFSHHDHM
jgi:hypothetical protein